MSVIKITHYRANDGWDSSERIPNFLHAYTAKEVATWAANHFVDFVLQKNAMRAALHRDASPYQSSPWPLRFDFYCDDLTTPAFSMRVSRRPPAGWVYSAEPVETTLADEVVGPEEG